MRMHATRAAATLMLALLVPTWLGCETINTTVVFDNRYPASATNALVVYRAFWHAVEFTTPFPPGASSEPESTVPASVNPAYVVLTPGLDPASDAGPGGPTSFVVLQSRSGFSVSLNGTLRIPVDDVTFAGNCAGGSVLTQDQADFITERVFAGDFAGLRYDAATCTTVPAP